MQPRDDLRDALNQRSIPQDKFVTIELGQTVSYKCGGVDDKTSGDAEAKAKVESEIK